MPLEPRDHALSMMISPRSKRPDMPGLRTLLVHRLTDGLKLVWRRSLQREDNIGVLCEGCSSWTRFTDGKLPMFYTCLGCDREFRVEFAVYEELEPEDEDEEPVEADDVDDVVDIEVTGIGPVAWRQP